MAGPHAAGSTEPGIPHYPLVIARDPLTLG